MTMQMVTDKHMKKLRLSSWITCTAGQQMGPCSPGHSSSRGLMEKEQKQRGLAKAT
uniref:Uncharacterized protein n=1 Tax=Setaria viridis TaxID=4556 RepID=A0A4U6V6K1_SETVI|nr:hypothetical protein SEVIR_3G076901v2 [Setaria viridis]